MTDFPHCPADTAKAPIEGLSVTTNSDGVHVTTGIHQLVDRWITEYQASKTGSDATSVGQALAITAEKGDLQTFQQVKSKYDLLDQPDKNYAGCVALETNIKDRTSVPGLPTLVLVTATEAGSRPNVRDVEIKSDKSH